MDEAAIGYFNSLKADHRELESEIQELQRLRTLEKEGVARRIAAVSKEKHPEDPAVNAQVAEILEASTKWRAELAEKIALKNDMLSRDRRAYAAMASVVQRRRTEIAGHNHSKSGYKHPDEPIPSIENDDDINIGGNAIASGAGKTPSRQPTPSSASDTGGTESSASDAATTVPPFDIVPNDPTQSIKKTVMANYPIIVERADGKLVQLHCSFCKCNGYLIRKTPRFMFFSGSRGILNHMMRIHNSSIADWPRPRTGAVEGRCVVKEITDEDLKELFDGINGTGGYEIEEVHEPIATVVAHQVNAGGSHGGERKEDESEDVDWVEEVDHAARRDA